MGYEEIMMVPKLSVDEYSEIVTDHNRRIRRGTIEPCISHRWARLPQDTDADPHMICVYCLRPYRPDVRQARPGDGRHASPIRGRGQPL